jgi:glutaminase
VVTVLNLYFHQCALRMSCRQLARAAGYLCRDGAYPSGGGDQVGSGSGVPVRAMRKLTLACEPREGCQRQCCGRTSRATLNGRFQQ